MCVYIVGGGGDVQDGRTPFKFQAKGRPGGGVHPKVEEEAAHGGNDKEGRHGKALEAQRRHAVYRAQEKTCTSPKNSSEATPVSKPHRK